MDDSSDLISQLPDPILCSIISLLKIKEAIRTGALSTRWKDLWKHAPALDFDPRTMMFRRPPPDDVTTPRSFDVRAMETVDDVMAAHMAALRSCSLIHYECTKGGGDENEIVSRWIRRLVTEKSIRELRLERVRTTHRRTLAGAVAMNTMTFPEGAFRCGTLRSLSLTSYVLPDASPFSACANIGTLKLVSVRMSDETLARVLLGCASLESLSLRSCGGFDELKIRDHRNLKLLEVADLAVKKIEIRASGLKVLRVDSITAGTPRIGLSCPNLTELQVYKRRRGRHLWRSEGKWWHNVMYFLERCCGILDFDNVLVEEDQLGNYRLGYNINPIENLLVLSISFDLNKIKAQIVMSKIFRVCHRLKKLYISIQIDNESGDDHPDQLPYDKSTFWDKQELSDSLSHHMKVVSIKGFQGRELEVDFASYLIRNSPMLEKLTIQFCTKTVARKEAQDLLLSLPRASLDVDIIFSSTEEKQGDGNNKICEELFAGRKRIKLSSCHH